MRTNADALRSLRQYVWRVLENDAPPMWQGEKRPWEIRLWGQEGEFGFPFARVAAITAASMTGPATWREVTRTFAVHLYPVPILSNAEDSLMEVERVEEIVTLAFESGITYIDKPDPNDPLTWVQVRSKPRRIPLYDFTDVPLDGAASVSYVRAPNDYLRVMTAPINRIVDPEDDRYWLITVEAQVTWRRSTNLISDGPPVQSVKLTEIGS